MESESSFHGKPCMKCQIWWIAGCDSCWFDNTVSGAVAQIQKTTFKVIFLNLPFLANFYKLTGLSGTTTTTTNFDKLTNLQLIFCYSLQLIFCQYCRIIFSDIFWKNIFTWYFCNLFFAIPCNLFLANLLILHTPCKAQLNLQNLEANLQILLILLLKNYSTYDYARI